MGINNVLKTLIFLKVLVLLVLIFQATSVIAAPQDLSFSLPVYYSVGSTPFNIQTEDFNGDDKLDLVIVNRKSNNISIMLGRGDGTFNPQTTYTVGTEPGCVVVGDFNGDTNPDLAVTNVLNNNVSVLLGKGNGTFNPQVTYTVGVQPSNITTGDFNGDSIIDLSVSNSGSNNVSILLGKGNGTFNSHLTYSAGNQPLSIFSGDFNQDSKLDLVVGNYNNSSSNVSVLIGNGNGTFNSPVFYPVGSNPRVTAGDFNGDGNLDLAVANVINNNVSVLKGNGDGTFNPQVTYQVGSGPIHIISGDFDGDGIHDVVTANRNSAYISILPGNEDGAFFSHVIFSAGNKPFSVAAGDFNKDGKIDIAATNIDDNKITILLNTNTVQVNQPPVFVPIPAQTVDQGRELELVIRASDPNNNSLTFGATNLPAGATFDPATQIFSWVPGYTQVGNYSVRFQVSDGNLTASQNVVITVNKVNLPPVITIDSNQNANEGQLVSFTVSATDPNEDPLTFSVANLPLGAVFDPETQTFSWTPGYTQAGSYTVKFQVSDGSLTVSRDVLITVNQVNRPPVLAAIGDQTVDEGQTLQFTVSATDPDGDVLTYSATGIPEGAEFDPATQNFSWTPNYSQAGAYMVNFQVSDGIITSSKDVLITVNQVNLPPELAMIGDQTVNEGQSLQFILSATDPNEDQLTYTATGLPEGANYDPATQTFSWTPGYTQAGSYTVKFQVSDGSLTVSKDVFIIVNQVNQPPVLAAIGNQTVDEGQTLQFTVSATDSDGDALTYSAAGIPEGASFDPATQTFSWMPNYNQDGSYRINFQLSDGSLTVSSDVLITVNQVNRPPELAAIGNQIVDEGQLLKFTVSAIDPDGDVLTYSATGLPEGAEFDPVSQTFSWMPSYTQAGSYTVTFKLSDGSLKVSEDVIITVNQVNLPPILEAIVDQTVDEGKLLQFTVSAMDPDGDVLTYSATGIPEGAGFDPATQTFSWTPQQNQTGVYQIIFEVSDGVLKSNEVVIITVNEMMDQEMRFKALIQRLIRLIEKSKLSSHHKSKLILQLKKLANSKLTKTEINKFIAILHGIKGQSGKKVSNEVEDIIKNLYEEISGFPDHKDHKPDKDDHHGKDHKPDKDDRHEKDHKQDERRHPEKR